MSNFCSAKAAKVMLPAESNAIFQRGRTLSFLPGKQPTWTLIGCLTGKKPIRVHVLTSPRLALHRY